MTPIPTRHADHDPLAVAAHAAGDAAGAELDDALALVAACADCALLHHDLRSIAAAMPALPAAVRTRDFRLTPEQAASLRPSGLRRLLAPLAGPRFAFAGPLGTGLATLGIAGFLVAGAAGLPLAGSAAAPYANPETMSDDAALVGPSEAPAASVPEEAPAASARIDAYAGNAAPSGGVTGAGTGAGDGNGTGGDGPEAASPEIFTSGSGNGGGGPIGAAGAQVADPKATSPEALNLASPDTVTSLRQASVVPVPAAPATTPLFVLATLALVAGVLLGGLRLVARRAA